MAERESSDTIRVMNRFLERVEAKISTSNNPLATQTNITTKSNPFISYEDNYESPCLLDNIEEDIIEDSSN